MPMISAHKLVRRYGEEPGVTALDGVDLSVATGERVAIVGKSGSGKTTLLNLLAGLDRATSGSLVVDKQDIATIGSKQLARYRAQTIGVIFQSFQLIAQRSAEQNVELPLIILGIGKKERTKRVRDALEKVGLSHRLKHRPAELSGGEQQRVAIARAIVANPKVLLADEPTGNLDSTTASEVQQLMLDVCDRGNMTLVLITHDADLAASCSSRILRMHDGKLSEATS
ncbi:MAG: ABC transporter ATP-binding protein [Planctomycetaceae bacterium]